MNIIHRNTKKCTLNEISSYRINRRDIFRIWFIEITKQRKVNRVGVVKMILRYIKILYFSRTATLKQTLVISPKMITSDTLPSPFEGSEAYPKRPPSIKRTTAAPSPDPRSKQTRNAIKPHTNAKTTSLRCFEVEATPNNGAYIRLYKIAASHAFIYAYLIQ